MRRPPIESDTVRFPARANRRVPSRERRRVPVPRCHRLRDTGRPSARKIVPVKPIPASAFHRFTTAPGNHLPAGRKASVTGGSPDRIEGEIGIELVERQPAAGRPGRSAPQRRGARNGRHRPVSAPDRAALRRGRHQDHRAWRCAGRNRVRPVCPSKTRLSASAPPSRSVSA